MADQVTGKDFVLYTKLGTQYYPFACAREVSVSITTDKIELAPYTNGKFRSYIYGRSTGQITGSGVVKVEAGSGKYSIFDLLDFQQAHIVALAKYTLSDPQGNSRTYECTCLIDDVTLTGAVGSNASYNFTLTINGDPTISQTLVNPPLADVDTWDYTATGGETLISNAVLIGVDVLDIRRNGIGVQVILTGTPNNNQALFNPATGQITFGYALGVDEYILVIYVS